MTTSFLKSVRQRNSKAYAEQVTRQYSHTSLTLPLGSEVIYHTLALSMDAGVLVPPPQILFSIPGGSVPLTYGLNGQFQMSPGASPSGQREVPPHGDTDSSGEDASVSDESSVMQQSEAVTEQRATQFQPPVLSTPSPTRGRILPLTTTTTGSVNELFSNQMPTLSPRSSLPLFRISTATRGLSTSSLRPLSASKSVLLSSFSKNEFVSGSGSSTASLSSNCVRYPCSSLDNSSTARSTTAMPTARFITNAPVFPAKASSFGVQPPSWYLAVIFGTIGGVALLIFFITIIAVLFRRAKRRRMAKNIDVPWAPTPGDEEGRLFFGSRDFSSRYVNNKPDQQKDFAHGQLRTNDRGLGVPLGVGANESEYSLYNHPIPGSRLFSDDTLPPKSEKLNLGHHFRHGPTNALRLLPSHLIDEELAARGGDGAYSFSGRPVGLRKRSRGHLDDAFEVNPYINPPTDPLNLIKNETTSTLPKHQPLVDRLRNLGQHKEESRWDRLPTPGRDELKEDREPWASSFKASFLSAFNTLASGLKTNDSSGENGPDGDRLTQMPTRHRPSMVPFSRRTSTKSSAWILHEKGNGTGTVQFLPSLEKPYDVRTLTPGKLVPVLSFGQGRSSPASINNEKRDFQRTERLIYPRVPFLPATAITHPHRGKHSPSLTTRNPISRDSSVYSTSSSVAWKCDPPPSGRLAGTPVLDQHSGSHVDLDVVVLEPDVSSR